MSTHLQTLKNKLGEVAFRRKLKDQFEGKQIFYKGQPNDIEYRKIIKDRLKGYKKNFDYLTKLGVDFSSFFEFGAGVGQASMFLQNKYNGKGVVSDLSLETLSLAPKFLKLLKFKKMPKRIVCDAYHLPFKDNSLSFVFCYETLHHFPDPGPVLLELKRVLAPGGYFFFGGEPIAQAINLNLWRRDRHLRWWEKILKGMVILHFISRIGKSEVENNILEETFDLKTWQRSLDIFSEVDVTFSVFPFNHKFERQKYGDRNWLFPPPLKKLFLEFFGGGISAVCKKAEPRSMNNELRGINSFVCPNCRQRPQLNRNKQGLSCPNCKNRYPRRNGVIVLLPKDELKTLYP